MLLSRTCLKQSSRRIETRGVALILTLTFYWIFVRPVNSQTTFLTVERKDNLIHVSAQFSYEYPDEVLQSIEDGLKAEIEFQFRLYQENIGFFSFLGDRLILEKRISYNAFYDQYENKYIIESSSGAMQFFQNEEDFIKNFFVIRQFELSDSKRDKSSRYYILARIRLNPVKLIPPLTVISLFSNVGSTVSSWEKVWMH